MENKIKRNRIRCKQCSDVIESKHLYDFQSCTCGAVAVDGGLDYARRIFPGSPAEDYYEELVEYDGQ